MTKDKRKLHIAVTIAVMAFIFVQSQLPGDISGKESGIIVQWLAALTGIAEESLHLTVRKLAHFTEYAVLGACLAVNVRDRLRLQAGASAQPDLRSASAESADTAQNLAADTAVPAARRPASASCTAAQSLPPVQTPDPLHRTAPPGKHQDCHTAETSIGRTDHRTAQSARPFAIWQAAWLIGTAYAITDELHQYFIPGRACALLDVCIDSAGAALGAAVMAWILTRKK